MADEKKVTKRVAKQKGPKFRVGQVVMVRSGSSGDKYPVKLDHVTHIGTRSGTTWIDSLNNLEYESEMRPLTARERGGK